LRYDTNFSEDLAARLVSYLNLKLRSRKNLKSPKIIPSNNFCFKHHPPTPNSIEILLLVSEMKYVDRYERVSMPSDRVFFHRTHDNNALYEDTNQETTN